MRNTNKVIPQLKNRANKLSTIREATSVREIDLATLETVTGGCGPHNIIRIEFN
jgi:hypothetical protein